MCGIFGFYDFEYGNRNLDKTIFDKALDSMSHRGPDGRGTHTELGINLGHRRLSIIDLTEQALQPMCSIDKATWITYNGEIYNYLELRKTLISKRYTFKSNSDTEVLLNAYLEWGQDCVNHIRGMFSFAIWDSNKSELWLVRDQIGIKPLYYSIHKGCIYFASEISALLSIPQIPKQSDLCGINSFFSFGYIPAPSTGYKFIKQLLPGHSLVVSKDNKIKNLQYWDLPLNANKQSGSEEDILCEMEHIFNRVVKQQTISDVPLGIFLSAGTDSFAIARSLKKSGLENIRAFSIGFQNKEFNELDMTQLAAKALDYNLTSKIIDDSFVKEILKLVSPHAKDPFADSSSIPMYALCEMASKHVKVALSGDGADELLGGYSVYNANKYAEIYRQIPEFIKNDIIKPISNWVPDYGGKYTYREKAQRFIYGAERGKYHDHASWRVLLTKEQKKQVYSEDFYNEIKDHDPFLPYSDQILKAKNHGCLDLDAYLYSDLKFYLPNDMLVKVDRMSMANSLEVRVPFLDLDMVNFCWSLPTKYKVKNGKLKYILKKLICKEQPRELQKLPKSGFNIILNNFDSNPISQKVNHFGNYSKFLFEYLVYIFKTTTLQSNSKSQILKK